MRNITNLPAWERLLKRIVWKQIGDLKDKYILDFGSGEGASADHFAKENKVVAIEPWEEMLKYAAISFAANNPSDVITGTTKTYCPRSSGSGGGHRGGGGGGFHGGGGGGHRF